MPTKHIDNETWAMIEEMHVKAVKDNDQIVREFDLLRLIIQTGIQHVTDAQLSALAINRECGVFFFNSKSPLPRPHRTNPDPADCAELLLSGAADLIVVYGITNSGKSTLVERILAQLQGQDVQVFDSGDGGPAGDLLNAMGAVLNRRKAIATMWAKGPDEVNGAIMGYLINAQRTLIDNSNVKISPISE